MEGLIEYEKLRLKRRGSGLLPGIFLFIIYILALPELIKPIFSYFLHKFSHPVAGMLSIVVVHHISYTSHCLLLYLFSVLKIDFIEKYRVGKDWPFHLFNPAMKTMALNFVIIIPVVEFTFIKTGILSPRFDEAWPEYLQIFQHLFFCMIAEDIWSYVGHRLMHSPFLYSRVHKKHHEYKSSIGYSAEYAHPIEFFSVNIIASGFGPVILGQNIHFLTFLVWIVYRIGDTVDQHGGYDFPCSPFSILPFASKI